MKNKLKVVIMHKEYTLMSEETQEYTNRIALSVDSRISSLLKKAPSLSTMDAAVLTALDIMDELEKANQNIENIRSQIKDYVDDAGRARTQANDSQREIRALKEKIEMLEKELSERTNFVSTEVSDEKISAEDILSQEIREAIEKPSDAATRESRSAYAQPSQQQKNLGSFAGMVNYAPEGGHQ